MNNGQDTEKTNVQKELDELRARLQQSSIAMQKSSKKPKATQMMAGAIETIGTFEKS